MYEREDTHIMLHSNTYRSGHFSSQTQTHGTDTIRKTVSITFDILDEVCIVISIDFLGFRPSSP